MNTAEYEAAQQAQKLYSSCVQHIIDGRESDFKVTLEEYLAKHNYVKVQDVLVGFQSAGKTFIHVACSCNRKGIVEYLLSLSPSSTATTELVNLADEAGFTPLMNATCGEAQDIMVLLLSHGAEVNRVNKDGAAAIHFACGDGSISRLQLLVQHGADINQSSKAGAPLHWAAGKGHLSVVQYLVTSGADISKKSGDGLTAVLMAAAISRDDIVCYLIDAGADIAVNLPDNTNLLHICAEHGLKQAVVKILQSSSGSHLSHAETRDRNLAIHLAAMSKHKDIVSLLLDREEQYYRSISGVSGRDELLDHYMREGESRLEMWHAAQKEKLQQKQQPTSPSSETLAVDISTLAEASPESMQLSDEHKAKGNNFFRNKQYAEAIAEYSLAIELYPKNHVLYSNRSACYLSAKDLSNALRDAEICRHLAPKWPKGCYRLAAARFALEMYEDAAVAAYEGCQLDDESHELKSLMKLAIKKGREEHQKKMSGGC